MHMSLVRNLAWIKFDYSKEDSAASVVYNYKHGFSGFAAMLTPKQAKQLAGQLSLPSITFWISLAYIGV
jgi:hypothetical protein